VVNSRVLPLIDASALQTSAALFELVNSDICLRFRLRATPYVIVLIHALRAAMRWFSTKQGSRAL
jgi:hypothetical protein